MTLVPAGRKDPDADRWRGWSWDRPPNDDDEEPWWRERRWIIAIILIALMIFIGAMLILLNREARAADRDARPLEPGTDVAVSAPEAGTSAQVSDEGIPTTVLRVTGRGGAIAPQTVVVLDEDVLFDFDAATLRPDGVALLDQVTDLIVASQDSTIEVVGHTDAIGTEGYNLELSQERTVAAVRYLVSQGVSQGRLLSDWRGESEPVQPNTGFFGNDNPEGRAQNRRVEVVIDERGAAAAAPSGSRLGADEHPNGAVLAVDALTVAEKGIVVDARIANRSPSPIELADDPVWLVDNLGVAYRLQPSWQNPKVSMAGGTTVTAKLAFLGIVAPDASSFTLLTNVADPNDSVDRDRRSETDSTPSFIVESIPRG